MSQAQLSNRLCISCGEIHSRQTLVKHYHECVRTLNKERPQNDEKMEKSEVVDELPKINLESHKAAVLEGVQEDFQNIERVPCPICERKFATDAIDRHINSCQKVNSKRPRKSYDAQKHRLQGTGAAEFVKKATSNSVMSSTPSPSSVDRKPSSKKATSKFNPTFEPSKDNKFASNEKLAKDDGLVECPSCKRRFNPDSAEKHIPYCLEQQRLNIHKQNDPNKKKELQKRTQYKPPLPGTKVNNKSGDALDKSQPPPVVVRGSFCSNCGTNNEAAKKYCINCGYKNQL